MSETEQIGTSLLIPAVEKGVRFAEAFFPYTWIRWLLRKSGRWRDDELIPFWFAEIYVLTFLVVLVSIFVLVTTDSWLFTAGLVLAGYRLLDLAIAILSIMLFEPKRRSDEQGGYILARERSRWVALTFINLIEILVCFAFFHNFFSYNYNPRLTSKIAALYQSASAFIAGGGAMPTTKSTQVLGLVNFLYFVIFFSLAAPTIFSLVRAKERTSETLGSTPQPDERI